MERLLALTQLVSLLLVGMVAGIFVATQLGQVQVQKTLGARDFALVKHLFEIALGGLMPVLVIAAAISILAVLALSSVAGSRTVLLLAILALALWVGAVVITLVYNAPVNAPGILSRLPPTGRRYATSGTWARPSVPPSRSAHSCAWPSVLFGRGSHPDEFGIA
jgi:hypothetical protein